MSDQLLGFLAMGGHAQFVWPALAVTAIVLVGLLLASLRRLRADEAALRALEGDRRGRRGA